MLSRESAQTVVSLLSNRSDPVSSIHSQFETALTLPERISALTAMSVLLSHAIFDHYQQIVVAWLIYAEFEDGPLDQNPFIGTLTYINSARSSQPNVFSPSLCDLIPIILSDTPLDFLRVLTIPQIVRCDAFSAPQQECNSKLSRSSAVCDPLIIPLVVDSVDAPDGAALDHVLLELLSSVNLAQAYDGIIVRPEPDVCPVFPGECDADDMLCGIPVLFDVTEDCVSREEGRSLLKRAAVSPLKRSESTALLDAVRRFPSLLDDSIVEVLASIMENNGWVGKKLVTLLAEVVPGILNAVTHLGISLDVVEIISYLIEHKLFSDERICEYISNTIANITGESDRTVVVAKSQLFYRMMIVVKPNERCLTNDVRLTVRTFCLDIAMLGISEGAELLRLMG